MEGCVRRHGQSLSVPRPDSSLNQPAIRVNHTPHVYSVRFTQRLQSKMTSRSPAAVTPLRRTSSAVPDTPTRGATTSPETVAFPPPQTFDVIPPLHGLLQRLLSTEVSSSALPAGQTPSQAQSQQPGVITGVDAAASVPGRPSAPAVPETSALSSNASVPLDVKRLPTESSSIRIRIQKARAIVESLPDVQRSVADQEREIEELEDRISRLRSVLADFGKRAAVGNPDKMDTH